MGLFAMPSLGADMEAGTLQEWLVRPGDPVRRGDVIAVVETQKGAIEIECFEEGEVRELLAEPGVKLPVGAPLALILGPNEAAPDAPMAKARAEPAPVAVPEPEVQPQTPRPTADIPTPPSRLTASPAARVRARELGMDLSALTGSGPHGAVLLSDVEARRGGQASRKAQRPSQPDEMRKAIAAAMTRAKQTIPHFYLSQTMEVQTSMEWLERRNEGLPPGDRLVLGALLVRSAVQAAQAVPVMNGHFVDGRFRPSANVNAGVAISLRGGGLVAPTLNDAQDMTLEATMTAMRDLVTRARAGRLRSSEMAGGTITISSLGETSAEAMAGVIFPPQVALVGIGAPSLRPWVHNEKVVPRMVVTVTVSADHRVCDGRQAARYVAEFERLITSPEDL